MNTSYPESPLRNLTAVELESFREDGVVCARQILPAAWLTRIARGVDRVYDSPTAIGDIVSMKDRGFMGDLFMWLVDDDFRAVVFESPLSRIASQTLGSSSVTHWYDQLFVKEPGSEVPTPWHHDLTFWPIRGQQIVSIWIPLDPVTRFSSGLEYVKGSHRWPNRFKAITPDHNEYMINPDLEDVPDIETNRDAYDLVNWDMEPGDVLIFHPLIVHGSAGNASPTTRRRALASRWVGDDVTYAPQRHTMPIPEGHNLMPGDQLGGKLFPEVLSG